jgi:hypothetical protein
MRLIGQADRVRISVEETDCGPMLMVRIRTSEGTFVLATPEAMDALQLAARLLQAAHTLDPALVDSFAEEDA